MKPPVRLDQMLVERGLAESRTRAQMMIRMGAVLVDGKIAKKPSLQINTETVTLEGDPLPWVSRGALKLVAALDHFELDPTGAVVLDVGASTGGFTEVLRARGARQVYAVDVGRGQLHERVARDPGVVSLEGLDARNLTDEVIMADWVTADLSFISVSKALPVPLSLARPGAMAVILIKPQFELSPAAIGRGGIVKDETAHEAACAAVRTFMTGEGWDIEGIIPSPVAGGDGNREFLLAACKVTPPTVHLDPDAYSASQARQRR